MVSKRKLPSGTIDWYYCFDLPGSTKKKRLRARKAGFRTKLAAQNAEAAARLQAQATTKVRDPKSLAALLQEFFAAPRGLGELTLERYRELADYLHPDLLATSITEVTALQLHKEWNRLLACGGRTRKDKTPRPLGAQTVKSTCRMVSSAFSYALLFGLVTTNPAKASQPPKVQRSEKAALTPQQQRLLIEGSGSQPWIAPLLELDAATGCRRGELLALEWTDIVGSTLFIRRSLSHTKKGLILKSTKTDRPREVVLPESALVVLETHRRSQATFREHFGEGYQGNWIFANPNGSLLLPNSVSSAVSLLFGRLKIPKPKGAALHLLRHSHGSHLIASGVPITDVSKRLGHANIATTMSIYAHALPDRDGEAARKWEEFQQQHLT